MVESGHSQTWRMSKIRQNGRVQALFALCQLVYTLVCTDNPNPSLLLLPLHVGATEAQYLENFKEWLELFTLVYCQSVCLVNDLDGNHIYGLFHHMLKGEHDDFMSHLSNIGLWATQCQNANISAGKYFAVAPSSRGETQFTHIRLGPLQ